MQQLGPPQEHHHHFHPPLVYSLLSTLLNPTMIQSSWYLDAALLLSQPVGGRSLTETLTNTRTGDQRDGSSARSGLTVIWSPLQQTQTSFLTSGTCSIGSPCFECQTTNTTQVSFIAVFTHQTDFSLSVCDWVVTNTSDCGLMNRGGRVWGMRMVVVLMNFLFL